MFRTLYLGNKKFAEGQTDIKVGDEVIIFGKLMNYKGNTPETDANNSYLYSLNGKTSDEGGDTPGPGGESEDLKTATVAEFLAAADSKTQPYKLTGKVSKIANATYGNFDLTDATGTVYVYGLVAKDLGGYGPNEANDKSFASIGIKEGDEITIIGYRETYNSKDEVMGAYYVSGASGSGETPGGDTPGGDTPEVSGNTIVFSSLSIENSKQYNGSGDDKTVINATDFKVAFGKGANDGKYYSTGEGIRTYGNGYIRVESSTKTITKVVYTFQKATATSGSGDKAVTFKTYPISGDCTVNTGSVSIGEATTTWTGSSKSIIMTRASGSGHWRLQKVEVTFAE